MNTKMETITAPLAGYEDKWVALTDRLDKVIASGESLKKVMTDASSKKQKNLVFMKVLPSSFTVSPHGYGV